MSQINEALRQIRNVIQHKENVVFVVHFWNDFLNLSPNGLLFPQITSPMIPGRELIPIVEITQHHLDSRMDPRTNKYVPKIVAYTQDIHSTWIDLYRRYAKFGIAKLDVLNSDLSEAEYLMETFSRVMKAAAGMPLEQMPAFFGGVSPVRTQFDANYRDPQTTYAKELDKMFSSGTITDSAYQKLMAAAPQLAESASAAHERALGPTWGQLTVSITDINAGRKLAFDQTDNWIISQFPSFNHSTRITVSKNDDQLGRLANILTQALAGKVQDTPVTPAEVSTVLSAVEPEAAPEPIVLQCAGTTKAGARCKREALGGSPYCSAHQPKDAAEE